VKTEKNMVEQKHGKFKDLPRSFIRRIVQRSIFIADPSGEQLTEAIFGNVIQVAEPSRSRIRKCKLF